MASQLHIEATLGISGEMSEHILAEIIQNISSEDWNEKLKAIFSWVSLVLLVLGLSIESILPIVKK